MIDPRPIWQRTAEQRDRAARRLDRERRKARGLSTPRLRTILLVELDAISMPAWARRKAIRGLTITASTVWLGRIDGRVLERLDRQCGGHPKVTSERYRRCRVCKRPLLGLDAEHRLELDRRWAGDGTPCSQECVEIAAARQKRKGGGMIRRG